MVKNAYYKFLKHKVMIINYLCCPTENVEMSSLPPCDTIKQQILIKSLKSGSRELFTDLRV